MAAVMADLGGLAAGDEAGVESADGGIAADAVRVDMYGALRTLVLAADHLDQLAAAGAERAGRTP